MNTLFSRPPLDDRDKLSMPMSEQEPIPSARSEQEIVERLHRIGRPKRRKTGSNRLVMSLALITMGLLTIGGILASTLPPVLFD